MAAADSEDEEQAVGKDQDLDNMFSATNNVGETDDDLTIAEDAYFMNDLVLAQSSCESAIAKNPHDADAHALLHIVLRDRGMLSEALQSVGAWRLGCGENPRQLRAWVEVSYIANNLNALTEACTALAKRPLARDEPSNMYLRVFSAALAADLGAINLADSVLDSCQGLVVPNEYCNLVDILVAWVDRCTVGKKTKGIAQLQNLEMGEHEKRLCISLLALAHLESGDTEKCSAILSNLSASDKVDPNIAGVEAILLRKLGKEPEAKSRAVAARNGSNLLVSHRL